jgi:integrase
MASVCNDKNGTRRVTFVSGDRKHRSIRLGKVSKKQAEMFCLRVEQLLQDQALGTTHNASMIEWIKGLPPATTKRLQAAGLVAAATGAATLGELIERFKSGRTVKCSTMATYKQCTDSLLLHLGTNTPIDRITPADADAWRATISAGGRVREREGPRSLSRATVAKRTNIAKAIFSKAKVWKLITTNPFAHMKSGSQSNPDRAHYISKEDTQKLLDACPNIQWRAMIGIARYAGLRCPSEIRELRWTDLNWEQKSLTVRSRKTEGNPNHAVRIVPVCVELQPILTELYEAAGEGAVEMVPQARRAHVNIFQGFKKVIERAGMKPWPRLLQNLRASCATDWAGEHPIHESAKWLGHSPTVAAKHYLQSKDLHFKAVTGSGPWIGSTPTESGAESGAVLAQKAAQIPAAPFSAELKSTALSLKQQRGCAGSCETVQPRASHFSGRRGIRTFAENPEESRGEDQSGAESGAVHLRADPDDGDLRMLANVWTTLSAEIRAVLLTMVRSVASESNGDQSARRS